MLYHALEFTASATRREHNIFYPRIWKRNRVNWSQVNLSSNLHWWWNSGWIVYLSSLLPLLFAFIRTNIYSAVSSNTRNPSVIVLWIWVIFLLNQGNGNDTICFFLWYYYYYSSKPNSRFFWCARLNQSHFLLYELNRIFKAMVWFILVPCLK